MVEKEAQGRDAEDERGDGVRSPFTTRMLFSVVMQQRERCPVGSPAADRKLESTLEPFLRRIESSHGTIESGNC